MLPTPGEVVAVGGGVDADLDIEGQQPDVTMRLKLGNVLIARTSPARAVRRPEDTIQLLANTVVHDGSSDS